MTHPETEEGAPHAGRFAASSARLLVALRWWVIGFWLVITLGAWFLLPSLGEDGGGGGLKGLVPEDTPAITAELRSVDLFGFPLAGRTALVQRDPDGLSPYAHARTVVSAFGVTRKPDERLPALRGALPFSNVLGAFPSSREQDTTALTYLLFDPDVSLGTQRRTALRYADLFFGPRDGYVGLTGSVPARAEQGDVIRESLPRVELLTLAAIVLIVGLAFRSLAAPVIAVLTTGVAYVVTLRLSGAVAELFGVATPSELEPVIVALLLGVVTDYTVFFLAAMRRQLRAGGSRLDAARRATTDYGHIVLVAGLAVAAGTAALIVAESLFFRALGPALVFTVLVGLVVAVTLVPALMAVLGRWSFWPSRPGSGTGESGRARGRRRRAALTAIAHRRRVAAWVLAGTVAGLTLAALPLSGLGLGVSFVGSLPPDSGVRQAADAARSGFSPGILSPTTLVVEGSGLTARRADLRRLGDRLEREPGVAGVLGPGDTPRRVENDVLVLDNGAAARFLVVLDDPALGATAIDSLLQLQERLPELVAASGLRDVSTGSGRRHRRRRVHRRPDPGRPGAHRRGRAGGQLPHAAALPSRTDRGRLPAGRQRAVPRRGPGADLPRLRRLGPGSGADLLRAVRRSGAAARLRLRLQHLRHRDDLGADTRPFAADGDRGDDARHRLLAAGGRAGARGQLRPAVGGPPRPVPPARLRHVRRHHDRRAGRALAAASRGADGRRQVELLATQAGRGWSHGLVARITTGARPTLRISDPAGASRRARPRPRG